jgi:hypothetical protein
MKKIVLLCSIFVNLIIADEKISNNIYYKDTNSSIVIDSNVTKRIYEDESYVLKYKIKQLESKLEDCKWKLGECKSEKVFEKANKISREYCDHLLREKEQRNQNYKYDSFQGSENRRLENENQQLLDENIRLKNSRPYQNPYKY